MGHITQTFKIARHLSCGVKWKKDTNKIDKNSFALIYLVAFTNKQTFL